MLHGSLKLLNDDKWHEVSYVTESVTSIAVVAPPEMINYAFGVNVEVKLVDGSHWIGFGGQNGRIGDLTSTNK